MKQLPNIIQKLNEAPWMILPGKFGEIVGIAERYMINEKLTADQIAKNIELTSFQSDDDRRVSEDQQPGGIAVISVLDTLVNRANLFDAISGATSYQTLIDKIDAASDVFDDIVLDFDSPGGSVNGVFQVVEAVARARGKKRKRSNRYTGENVRVFSAVNDMAASAAFLIAAHTDRIFVSQGSTLGSIGVMLVHMDFSEQDKARGIRKTVITSGEDKAVGNDSEPLSDDDKKKLQAEVDNLHDIFVSSVSAGREMKLEDVKALATGKTFRGQEAITLGLADEFLSLPALIEQIISEQTDMADNKDKDPISSQDSKKVASIEEVVSAQQEQITSLAASVGSLVKGLEAQQKASDDRAEKEKKAEAVALVNSAIRAGKIAPAQGPDLIEQAAENYDLVESILNGLQAKRAIPNLGQDPFGAPPQKQKDGQIAALDPEAAKIFKQLGMVDHEGNLTMQRVTLALNTEGQQEHFGATDLVNVNPDKTFVERIPSHQALAEGLHFLQTL